MAFRKHYQRKIQPHKAKGFWRVRVPDDLWIQGNIRRPRFDTLADANKFAKQLTDARKSSGAAFFSLPMAVQSQLLGLVRKHGADGLIEADRWLDQRKPEATKGFSQTAADCIGAKDAAGRLRANTQAKMWVSINSFAAVCNKSIHAITAKDITGWLDSKGGSLESRKSRLGIISEVFGYAVKKGILPRNPADEIERPKIQPKQAVILTVDEIKRIVQTAENHDKPLLGYLAPVIWGGLRHSESLRMKPDNIGAEVINLHGEQTKTGKRSFQITPTLKAWLAVDGVKAGSGTVNNKKRMAKIEQLSGVTIPRNALRKTCASMWFRLKGSREAAAICGHSEAMLERNYKNANILLEDAVAFEALRPSANSLDALLSTS
jgi:integrase